MIVVEITDQAQIQDLMRDFSRINDMRIRSGRLRSIRIGIEPGDHGVRFSLDWSTWSAPITGKVTVDK
jgi:hypothetical protein